jgi:hypothetical protein
MLASEASTQAPDLVLPSKHFSWARQSVDVAINAAITAA